MKCDYLIVGAGFFGSVLAERIANDMGKKVIVIDKRGHIGGNCFSEDDPETGIETHRYGTHIFHTVHRDVWDYITHFTEFNGYFHQVLTVHDGKVFQMPINLETINSFYNKNLTPGQAREFIAGEAAKEGIKEPINLEEKAVSSVGRPLYEAFIKNYTIKQWGKPPKELPASIVERLPVRYDYNETYFLDARWQGLPLEGYTRVFEKMLNSPNIIVELNMDYFKCKDNYQVAEKTIYTGPIDQFFDYKYGHLEWRTVDLKKQVLDIRDFQGTSVMNYADLDVEYTRIHEPRYLHRERGYPADRTVIFRETTRSGEEEPYYPVNDHSNQALLGRYRELASKEENVIIGGRLGDYAYYDMDRTIKAALECYNDIVDAKDRP